MAGARRCECRVRTQHRGIAAVSQRRLPRVSGGTREIMAVVGLGGTRGLRQRHRGRLPVCPSWSVLEAVESASTGDQWCEKQSWLH